MDAILAISISASSAKGVNATIAPPDPSLLTSNDRGEEGFQNITSSTVSIVDDISFRVNACAVLVNVDVRTGSYVNDNFILPSFSTLQALPSFYGQHLARMCERVSSLVFRGISTDRQCRMVESVERFYLPATFSAVLESHALPMRSLFHTLTLLAKNAH